MQFSITKLDKMKLSKQKKDKIAEQVLSVLYDSYPSPLFTAEIARNIARDEEFIKSIMFELKEKSLVISVKKNSKGQFYVRRVRWSLSNKAYEAYKELNSNKPYLESR